MSSMISAPCRVMLALLLLFLLLGTIAGSNAGAGLVVRQSLATSSQAVGLPWLHVEGNRIVDETGSPIILRGVVIEDPYTYKYDRTELRHSTWMDADFGQISQNWHANAVEVMVVPDFYHFGIVNFENYSTQILDPVVDAGRRYGVYIIISWHAHGNPINGTSPPDNMTGKAPYHGVPSDPDLNLAKQFWNDVAERYKNDPWVLYSIFNEPSHISWSDWRPVAEQLIDVVRSHNSKALIFVSGIDAAYDLRGVRSDPVQRQNVVYEAHIYPGNLIWYGSWENYFGFLSSNYPIFAGEWGFTPGSPNIALNATVSDFGKPLLDYFNRKGLSWAAYIWSTSWPPNILQDWNYQPTQFGQFVKVMLSSSAKQCLMVMRVMPGKIVSISHLALTMWLPVKNRPSQSLLETREAPLGRPPASPSASMSLTTRWLPSPS